jgi:hypothetical protein
VKCTKFPYSKPRFDQFWGGAEKGEKIIIQRQTTRVPVQTLISTNFIGRRWHMGQTQLLGNLSYNPK